MQIRTLKRNPRIHSNQTYHLHINSIQSHEHLFILDFIFSTMGNSSSNDYKRQKK